MQGAVKGVPWRRAFLKRRWLGSCAAGVLVLSVIGPAATAQNGVRSQFGTVGLIDMPSARMAADGAFAVSTAFFEKTERYVLSFQALPWLETSFRYTGLRDFSPDFTVFYDRSFGVKVRLWEESDNWPAIAVGTNDLVGTGVYSGEFIAASKQVGQLDFTLGLGWGRLANGATVRNPLTLISNSFETRDEASDVGQGGSFSFGRYFHGQKSGIFGGVSWQTPIEGLFLVAEYSSDQYTLENANGNFTPRHQVNLGLSYVPAEGVHLGAGWLYGRSVYANLTLSLDPTASPYSQRLGPALPPPAVRTSEDQQRALQSAFERRPGRQAAATSASLADVLWANAGLLDVNIAGQMLHLRVANPAAGQCEVLARQIAAHAFDITDVSINGAPPCRVPGALTFTPVAMSARAAGMGQTAMITIDAAGPARPSREQAQAAIRRKLEEQKITLLALSLGPGDALVYFQNLYYATEQDAIDRILRVLMAEAPPEVETFRMVSVINSVPQVQVEIPRGTAERSFEQMGTFDLFRDGARVSSAPMDNPVLRQGQRNSYPNFNWSVVPQFRQQFFDPANPLGVQFLVSADASLELLPGLRLMAQLEGNLYTNFNVTRASDSVLPRVRTDFVRYFSEGKTGLGMLQAEHNFRLDPNTHVTLRGGYLESMFAGVGGEILWRREGSRWALGADLYYVRQRNFDRLLGLRPYSQATGHVTFYYEAPWYDLNFQLRVGRYLAGDWGTTMQVTRRFASGLEIGAFATKTNVSAAQFGEGSFDKGLIIRIPLSHLIPVNTQQMFGMDLRPIQRDGGQTLSGDAQLYERMRRASEGELRRTAE
jgi:hypothetical protein